MTNISKPVAKPFDRATIEQALARLGDLAAAEGKIIELSVYGGSALVLTMDFRIATRDVDAVFESDKPFVRRAARIVAEEFGWEENWINDGVKGFLSSHDADPSAKSLFRSYPSEIGPGVRVLIASPEYLFAMKCLAMRAGGIESQDKLDIQNLGAHAGVTNVEGALTLVARYYPLDRLPPKTRFGLEEIFGRGAS